MVLSPDVGGLFLALCGLVGDGESGGGSVVVLGARVGGCSPEMRLPHMVVVVLS